MAANALRCYFPNGSVSPSVPCDPTANVTHCCLKREQCLSNGICAIDATLNYGVQFARGVCTDPTWKSPVCPKVCLLNPDTATNSSAHDFRANGAGIYECNGVGFAKEAEFCCESASEKTRCCSTPTAIFKMPAATFGAVAIHASTTPLIDIVLATPSASTLFAAPTSASMAISASISVSPTVSPDLGKISRGGAIGAGVGGALGGSLLTAALVVFLLKRRKKAANVVPETDDNVTFETITPAKDHYRHEMDVEQRHELDAPRPELPGKEMQFQELPDKRH